MNTSLSRTIQVTIGPNTYDISFPKTGEMLDIELLKYQITGDKYEVLKYALNPMSQQQALHAEAIATFNVMIPKLKKDLNVKSMFDLTLEQFEEVLIAYKDVYLPWYEEWQTLLAKPKEDQTVSQEKDA